MEAVLIVLVVFGSVVSMVLGQRYMRHREKLAELEVRRLEALSKVEERKALAEDRATLAKELLEAYDEVDGALERKSGAR